MANETKIPLFRRFVIQNFPYIEQDFDALTDYQLISKIVERLNQVITSQNNLVDDMNDLETAFNTLKDYVDHYFDNLDVQDEINQKLDGLVADGTLELLIGAYIQPRIDAQNTRIDTIETSVDTFEDTVNGTVSQLRSEISAVASGTPIPVASTDDMTDTTKVYVNTTDGKWYYYDGDSWEIGGTYQATGVADGEVTIAKLGTDVKYNLNSRINLKDKNKFVDTVTVDLTDNLVNKSVSSNGNLGADSNTRLASLNLIYIPFGYTIQCIQNPANMKVNIFYYGEDFSYSNFARPSEASVSQKVFINPKAWRYARLQFFWSDNSSIAPSDVTSSVKIVLQRAMNLDNDNTIGTNLINTYTTLDGYLDETKYYIYTPSASYKTTRPIPVKAGTTYYINSLRKFALYDKDMTIIAGTIEANAQTNYTFTPTVDGFAVVSYGVAVQPIMCEGESGSYVAYTETLPAYVQLQNTNNLSGIIASKNILTGKKYVALGDSFTHGDFTHAPEDDYHITEGTYAGQYKVYPYLIGNRNDMTIVNLAQNGMTMTKISNDWSNYISNGVLANIPSDADYITIKIGINDDPNHQNANLGTIDDDRDDTFYGRFNRVMNYLISNFPDAKIGILISNGIASLDFVNATIDIAKKFGVSYLNETTDDKVPLLIRTLRTDVDNSIKLARNNHWFVSTTVGATNSHPNAKCHEFESTIVENFLRTL